MKKRDCYFYSEYADMGAHIPCCGNNEGLGNCPCEECTDFLSKNDADKVVREYVKNKTKSVIKTQPQGGD